MTKELKLLALEEVRIFSFFKDCIHSIKVNSRWYSYQLAGLCFVTFALIFFCIK